MDPKTTRVMTTMLLGVAFGIICMLLSKYIDGVPYWPIGVSFLLHHTIMGLVIGVSSLRMHWAAHGAFWGAVFGLFLAISRIGTTQEPGFIFIFVIIWGFLIEILATKAFKRPQL